MKKKFFVLLGTFCLVAALAQASVVNSNVPNRGSRLYVFTPDFSGIALFTLIYENKVSDLDIRLAVRDSNEELVPLAFSESELSRYETLQIGVLGGVEYTIIVFSSIGGSPFRLSFEGTFSTSATGQAGAPSRGSELREIQPDARLLKFLEDTRKHSDEFKKKN